MKYQITLIVLTFVLAVPGCNRSPHKGQSAANKDPVLDNLVVLVRHGKNMGAFILYDQTTTPENTSFKWFARSDGGDTFLSSDPLVASGSEIDQTAINFSVFSIEWSANEDGKGWVYFSKLATEITTAASFEMCITTESDITKVDANDPKWVYRERPSINLKALVTP